MPRFVLPLFIVASCIWSPVRAQNGCTPTGLPFFENFNTTDTLPECWQRDQNFDQEDWRAHVTGEVKYEGIGSLMLTCGEGPSTIHRTFVIARELSQSPSGIRITMRVMANQAGATFMVGAGNRTSSIFYHYEFDTVQTVVVSTANVWQEVTIDFSNYSGSQMSPIFYMARDMQSSDNMKVYIDAVSVERCSVSDLWVSHRASDELTLHWSSVGEGTADLTATPVGGGNTLTFTGVSSPYRIMGLQPQTTYTLTLTPRCEGEALAGVEQSVTAQTLAGPHPGLVYCEDFEDASLAAGWTCSGTAASSAGASHSGSRRLYLGNANGNHAALPIIALTNGTIADINTLMLSMYIYSVGGNARLQLCAADYPEETAELVPIDTVETAIGNMWEHVTLTLQGYGGAMRYLVLRAIGGTVYVDDLRVGRCLMTGVGLTDRTSTSVTIEWDTPLFEGDVTLEPTAGGGNTLTVSQGECTAGGGKQRYTIDNLEPGSSHTWAVYGACDDGHCGAAAVSATTYAQEYTLPYCVDFEESGSLPTDWAASGTVGTATDQAHGGNRSLKLTSTSSQTGVAVMPPMSGTVTTVSFAAYAGTTGCQIDVGTTAADGTAFETAATVTPTSGQWERYTATVNIALDATMRLALRLRTTTSGQRSVWIDDLEAAACGVSAASAFDERANGATLQWTSTGGTVDVQLKVSGSSATQTVSGATSPLILDGLEPGTTYDYYLRSTCDSIEGCWAYGGSFTTNAGALTADYCHAATISVGTTPWNLNYLEEDDYTGLLLSLEARRTSGSGNLQVGLMTSDGDPQSFTVLATFTPGSGEWTRHSTTMTGHEADGHYIALRTTGGSFSVRHLRISHGSLTTVTVSGVSATTATIGWSAEGAVDSVRIYIDGVTDTVVAAGSGSYTQSGLVAGSTYQYTLTAISNASGHSCAVDDGSIATLDADVEEGYCYGFDGVTYGTLPTGWSSVGEGEAAVYYNSGSARLRLSSGPSSTAIATMPEAMQAVNNLQLRMDIGSSSSSPEQSMLVAGVMTDAGNGQTFVATDTVRPTSNMRTVILDLRSYNGNGRVIALKYISPGYQRNIFIDNIGLAQEAVGCVEPSELTSHSVRLSWEGCDEVQISYSGSTVTATGSSTTIDGLGAETGYTFTLVPSGADASEPCSSVQLTVQTLAVPMTVPLCLSLDDQNNSTHLPYGWTRPYGDYPQLTTSTRYEGSRSIYFYTGYGTTMCVSPMMEESSLQGYYLSFMLYNTSNGSTMEVGVMADPTDTSTFTHIGTFTSTSGWQRCEVSLATVPASAHYIAFRHSKPSGYASAYIDHVMLQTCPMPTMSIENPRPTSMDVVWSGADSVHIEWEMAGVQGTAVTATSPYTIEGLNPQTNYTVRVWPICDGDSEFECHKVEQQQQTLPPPQEIPYCQGFDNYSMPAGWTTISGTANIGTMTPSGSGRSLRMYATSATPTVIVLPMLDMPTTICSEVANAYLNLKVRRTSGSGLLVLGTVHDVTAGGTDFVPMDTIALGDEWTEMTVSLPATAVMQDFAALRFSSEQGASEVYIDQLCSGYCFGANVRLTGWTPTSATFEWGNYGAESLEVSWDGGSYTATTSPFTIEGLDPNVSYNFSFGASCPCDLAYNYSNGVTYERRLPALPMAVPSCFDLEEEPVGSFPDEWRYITSSNSYMPHMVSQPTYSGERALDLYSNYYTTVTMALAPLPDTVGDVVVGGRIFCSNTDAANEGRLVVGLMTDAENSASFTAVASVAIDAVDRWESFHVEIPQTLRTNGDYIAFRFTPNATYHIYLDDINVATSAVTSLTANGSTINVGLAGGATQYVLTINNDTDSNWRQLTLGNTTPALSTLGLASDTVYTLTATPLCSDGSQPECNAESLVVGRRIALPLCEDFGETDMLQPDGWEVLKHNDPRYPRIENGRYHMQPSGSAQANNDLVVLPTLPVGMSLGGINIRMDIELTNNNDRDYAYMEIGYLNGNTFIELAQLHNEALKQTHYLTLPACNGTRLALRARSTSGVRNLYLDNLQITVYPEPETFTLTQTGYQGQHIYWANTAGNSNYGIEWGPHGFAPGSGTTVQSDSCHVLLAPLSASTAYDYYMIDTAGNRFCQPHSFTSMPTSVALTYCDNNTHSMNAGMLLTLPEVLEPVNRLTLVLTWQAAAGGALVVGAMTDLIDNGTFVGIDTLYPNHANTAEHTAVNLYNYTDTGHFVAMKFIGASGTISQITLQEVPQPVFHVLCSSSIEATLDVDSADYYIGIGNQTLHVTDTHYTITGLQPYTQYNIYVSADGTTGCQPAVTLRTHLDVDIPYCTNLGTLPTGWNLMGPYHVMPYPLVESIAQLHIYFVGTGAISVGAMSALDDTTDFVVLGSVETNVPTEHHIDLAVDSATIGNRHYIALRYESANTAVQSFIVQRTPRPMFSALSSSEILATLPGYSEADYYIEVCTAGAQQGSGAMHHVTAPDYIISGLEMYTEYDLYARADENIVTCAPAARIRTHLDIEPPYCSVGDITGWYIEGNYRIMPYTVIDTMSNLYVTFRSRGEVSLGVQSTLTDTASFSALTSFSGSTWEEHTVKLGDYAEAVGVQHYVGFSGGETERVYLHTCPVPTAELTAFNTVTFSQAEDGIDYWIEYNDTVLHATSNPFNLTDLDQNTVYNFSYRCDSATATCLPPSTILTGVRLEVPYCVALGDYTMNGSTPAGQPGWFCTDGNNGERYVAMPIIHLDSIGGLYMRLRYRIGQQGTALAIGVMSDPLDESTFSAMTTISNVTPDIQTLCLSFRNYSAGGLYVAFRASGNAPQQVYIDNIELQTVPFADYLLTAYNEVLVSADDMPQPVAPFFIRCNDSLIAVDTLPYLVTGLEADATYLFNLQASTDAEPCAPSTAIATTHLGATPLCGYEAQLTAADAIWHGPELAEADISSLLMRFNAQTSGSGNRLVVGTLRIHNADSTFEPIDTVSISNGSGIYTVSLAAYAGSGRFIAVRLLPVNYSSNASLSDIVIDHCLTPLTAHLTLLRHNKVRLEANQEPLDGVRVEYGHAGFALGSGTTAYIDTLPLDFTLANSTTFEFYLLCDGSDTTCAAPLTIATQDAPPPLSWCADFDDNAVGSMPHNWLTANDNFAGQEINVVSDIVHSPQHSLHFNSAIGYGNIAILPDLGRDTLRGLALSLWMRTDNQATSLLEVGVISNTSDPTSFVPLDTVTCQAAGIWERKLVDLNDAPSDVYFIALRCRGSIGVNSFWIDDLHVAECGARDMVVTGVESESVRLRWRQTGNPQIAIEVQPYDSASWTVTPPEATVYGTRYYTIEGLSPLTNYNFVFNATCNGSSDYCTTDYTDSVHIFAPAGGNGCIDPTNLTASYTTCTYGTYGNPLQDTGAIDYGYASAMSRHTVHYDLDERDPRTGNELHTVPEGSIASVRLGNWATRGYESGTGDAESITYGLLVDTMEFNMLILHYAAVLQDPMHADTAQPRFSLELLKMVDGHLQVIDSTCGRADFIANYQMGWHIAPGGVLWKSWTTVGLDLTPYAGQDIYVRLVTRDCNEGSHYGYAYFTLECGSKNIVASGCGVIEENNLRAPSGFNYRWYTSTDTATISTAQEITVPSDNSITYLCNVSFVDNPTCQFTMSAFAGTRYPLSLFDYDVSLGPCRFDVSFTNHSTISMDQVNPVGTGEGVESSLWTFGNGEGSSATHPSTTYYDTGTYTVSLVTGIADDACLDTLEVPIVLAFPPTGLRIEGPAERCWNAPDDTLHLYNACDDWLPDDTLWTLADADSVGTHLLKHYILIVDSASYAAGDYSFSISALDSVGCTVSLSHSLTIHPIYRFYDTEHICSLLLPHSWRDTTVNDANTQPVDTNIYVLNRLSLHGCDSVMTLTLLQYDNAHFTPRDTAYDGVCDNSSYYFSDSLLVPVAGQTQMVYTDSLFSSIGCDSLSTIVLTVHPTYDHHFYDTVCQNQYYYWGTPYRLMFEPGYYNAVQHAADSAATHYQTAQDTSYLDSLLSTFGCDSLSSLHLNIPPAYNLIYCDTICSGEWRTESGEWLSHTYAFEDSTYTLTGVYTHSFSTLLTPLSTTISCDSSRTLQLKVYPSYDYHIYDTIYDGDTYIFEQTVYDTTGIYSHMLEAVYSCDSMRTLHLQRNRRTFLDSVVCRNTLPFTWNHIDWATGNGRWTTTTHGWAAVRDSVHLAGQDGIDSLVVMTLIVRDTSATTDFVHSCDSFLWANNQTLYYATTSAPSVVYSQLRPLDTVGIGSTLPDTHFEPWSQHLAPYSIQCDSVRHLSLTVDYTHYFTDVQIACDSMRWIDARWYYRDSLGIVGPLGSHQATGPVDTLTTVGGCDSVVNLDLAVRYSTYHCDIDTFCWAETYTWRSQTAGDTAEAHWPQTENYYLSETLQTHVFAHPTDSRTTIQCDSVMAIALTQMARPQLRLRDTIDCARRQYTLTLLTDVAYTQWTANDGGALFSNDTSVTVSPQQRTTYYAYVDYHRTPLCPLVDSLRMRPIVVPEAVLRVNPQALRYNEMDFVAYDNSTVRPSAIHAEDPEVWSRSWTVGDAALGTTEPIIHEAALPDDDTVSIALSVFNGQCYDTAIALLPVLRTALFVPNVFTPLEESNNLFLIVMQGITEAHIYIYNREGLLVHRSDDPAAGWDGRDLGGNLCPQGSYVWKLIYRAVDRPEAERTEVGTVLLLK